MLSSFLANAASYYVQWMQYDKLINAIYSNVGKIEGIPAIGGI